MDEIELRKEDILSISPVNSAPAAAAPASIRDNEAAEQVPDNEAAEAAPRNTLHAYQGTKIDVSV